MHRLVGKGMSVPLSEEEQRILQEMEQKLRDHDRDFFGRVASGSHRFRGSRTARWSAVGFVAGLVLMLATFRSSVALGACGFLVMLFCTLAFAQQMTDDRQGHLDREAGGEDRSTVSGQGFRSQGLVEELSHIRRRMRSRFGRRE
ncbi:MAG: DUF3040 domain-containing protein [Acidimicrobiales bacterium]